MYFMEIDFNKYFYYDESSTTGLRWRIDKQYRPKLKDKEAGGLYGDRFVLKLFQRRFVVARVIWEMFNGPIPEEMVIDHLNGNPRDNRISNLACKTIKHNSQNCKMNKRNRSGFVGVHYNYKNDKLIEVVAKIFRNKQNILKTFSIGTYGVDKALELAIQWRKDQIQNLNFQGEDYTERHGTKTDEGS